jgi:aspartate/methionine/tyrosine aminotransferase
VGSRATDARIEEIARNGGGRSKPEVLQLRPYPVRQLPQHVVESVERAICDVVNPSSRGLPDLREAISATLWRELAMCFDPQTEVLITTGSMHALSIAFNALLEPEDEVLVPAPCYFLEGIIEPLGARIVYAPMDETKGYSWDFDLIRSLITPRTKCFFVNTPVNPSGYVLSPADMAEIARLAEKHNLLVIADESYNTMVYDGLVHHSIAALSEMKSRTLLIRSFTKSFSMPGWRVGYVVAHPDLVAAMTNTLEWNVLYGSYITQVAAAAALSGPLDWLAGVAREFQQKRDFLCDGIQDISGLSCVRPSGGPFLFLNISRFGGDSLRISHLLLEEYGIPTTPGVYFHSSEHVRMAFGGGPELLREALSRLGSATRNLATSGLKS